MNFRYWNSYKVFENGDVYSQSGKLISFCSNRKGYKLSRLKSSDGKWRTITHHNVVAQAWLGPRPEGFEIDHINNIRDDNRVANLRYVSRTENRVKSYREGFRDVKGEKNANAKYGDKIQDICGSLDAHYQYGNNFGVCGLVAELHDVPIGVVRNVWSGRQWRTVSIKYSFSSRFRD